MKKWIIYLLILTLAVTGFAACKKKQGAQADPTATADATATTGVESTATAEATPAAAAVVPYETPTVTKEEAKVMVEEQKKVVEEAKEQEAEAEKQVAQKVVTSSVAESAPVPDGFPVQNVPIIQGAQIVSASKDGNRYEMTLRVNIPAKDAYKYYFDLYDAIGSVKITSKTENASLSMERSKSGLKADFTFADESETTSTISMHVTQDA